MASRDVGPSYRDVEDLIRLLRHDYNVGVRFEVFPPLRPSVPRETPSWRVVARVWRLATDDQLETSFAHNYGVGSKYATMPAAMAACLRDAYDLLDDQMAAQSKRLPGL